ncbi:hypothetical protein [Streptosporangium sp. NPDC051022]
MVDRDRGKLEKLAVLDGCVPLRSSGGSMFIVNRFDRITVNPAV